MVKIENGAAIHRKMTAFKSGIFLMFIFIEQSTQLSISSALDSEQSSNQTGCLKTIGQCLRLRPNDLPACAIEHALNNMECLIASNKTWHINEFVSLKKNDEWKPTQVEARQDQSLIESAITKVSDLIASRSIQLSMPQGDLSAEGRVKSGFDFAALNSYGGLGGKKSDHKLFICQSFEILTSLYFRSKEEAEAWIYGWKYDADCNVRAAVFGENCIFGRSCIAAIQSFTVIFNCRMTLLHLFMTKPRETPWSTHG